MSFLKSLKKAVKDVAKVATAPITVPLAVTAVALEKTGVNQAVNKSVGMDLSNVATQASNVYTGNFSTGDSEFRKAMWDGAKLGVIAGTAGAGASALGYTGLGTSTGLTATQGALGLGLLSKVQKGGGLSLGDVASASGFDTSIDSPWGSFNFDKLNLVNADSASNDMSYLGGNAVDSSYSTPTENKKIFYVVGGLVGVLFLIIFLTRNKRR